MQRTQIQLTVDQHRRLKELAYRRGLSLSAVIRRWVEEKLAEEETAGGREATVRAALAICGKYSDPEGRADVGADHDRHLAEAYGK